MGATTGVNFIIKVKSDSDYVTVAGQRGATLSRSVDLADVTSKDSDGWEENLPTIRHWSIDFDGLLIEDDTGYGLLEAAYLGNEQVLVQMQTASGTVYSGLATLTDFPIDAPYDDAVTISGTLQGTGPLTKA